MSPAARASPSNSPRAEGRFLGARLLELGRLQPCKKEELLVIETSPATACAAASRQLDPVHLFAAAKDGQWPPSTCCSSSSSSSCANSTAADEAEDEEPIVEADLTLEDYSPDEEEESWRDLSVGLPALWAPGSAKGRRLMTARAKQCVICMEEKEHTLVPPHKGHHYDASLEGHRVCTDCWDELLQHAMDRHWDWQHSRRGQPPTLACPVCRADVEVPDAWDVEEDLPKEWVQRCAPCAAGDEPDSGLAEPQLWADAAAVACQAASRRAGGTATNCPDGCWRWLCSGLSRSGDEEKVAVERGDRAL